MTGIDLDALKARWQQQSARADAKLQLDVAAVRATLAARSTSAFQRFARRLRAALVVDALALITLVAFVLRHGVDWVYLCVGLAFVAVTLAETLTDLHEWRVVRHLDGSAPLTAVQVTLDDLRSRRLRTTRWILLLSVLLWWPLLAVVMKGLLGFDLLRTLHWSVAVVNLLAGLAFIPLGAGIARWISRRYAASPAFQRLLDGMAGHSFDHARQSIETLERFDMGVAAATDPARLAERLQHATWPNAAQTPLRMLRRRLLLGIFFYATLLVATGLFNASHGGQVQFIVPGVLLNFLWVALMVGGIEHRVQLSRLVAGHDCESAGSAMFAIAAWRAAVARMIIAALPLLALAAAQVLSKLVFGPDLYALIGASAGAVLLLIALAASIGLFRRARRDRDGFAPRLADALCFGAIGATRRLAATLAATR